MAALENDTHMMTNRAALRAIPLAVGSVRSQFFSRREIAGIYSIFTSGVYKATALDAAFPQEKPHFPEPDCAE
jgi:hypothetical protein